MICKACVYMLFLLGFVKNFCMSAAKSNYYVYSTCKCFSRMKIALFNDRTNYFASTLFKDDFVFALN